jgi:hypothetical protein
MKKVSDSTTLTVASVFEAKGEPAEQLEEVSVGEGKVLQIGTQQRRSRRPRELSPQEY